MDPARLKAIAVFAPLDNAVVAELAAVVEERSFADGERVFTEGDPGDTMFCVAEGVVRIEKRIQEGGTATKTLSILVPGELFGEMSVIDSKPRSASALASGPTRLLCLPRPAFEALLARNQHSAMRLLFSLMRGMNERIRRLNSSVIAYDEIGRAIGAAENLQPLLDLVLTQLVASIGAERGLIFLRSQFGPALEPRAATGIDSTSIPTEHPGDSSSLLARILQEKCGWVVGDRTVDPRVAASPPRPWEGRSWLATPVQLGTEQLGVIVLGHSQPAQFDLNHLNLAEGIARQTAQAILNLRHREEQQSRARLGRQFVKF